MSILTDSDLTSPLYSLPLGILSLGLVILKPTTDKYLRCRKDKEDATLSPNSEDRQTIKRVMGNYIMEL